MIRIKHLIFDLDETLIRLPVDWPAVYEEVRRSLEISFTDLLNLLTELWGTKDYGKVSRLIEKFELEALNRVYILDNSRELVLNLSKKFKLSLVTLQGRNVVEKILSGLGIRKIFEVVVTRDGAPTRFLQLRRVLDETGFRPEETLVIGDKLDDIESALKLGCWAVLVDRRGRAELLDEPREKLFVIKNLKDLEKVLYFLQEERRSPG